MDEGEIRKLKWWHDHHKSNLQYLVMRLEQYFSGETVALDLIRSAMPGYVQLYGEVPESESEAKTAE